jgi:hypothetical protein
MTLLGVSMVLVIDALLEVEMAAFRPPIHAAVAGRDPRLAAWAKRPVSASRLYRKE